MEGPFKVKHPESSNVQDGILEDTVAVWTAGRLCHGRTEASVSKVREESRVEDKH